MYKSISYTLVHGLYTHSSQDFPQGLHINASPLFFFVYLFAYIRSRTIPSRWPCPLATRLIPKTSPLKIKSKVFAAFFDFLGSDTRDLCPCIDSCSSLVLGGHQPPNIRVCTRSLLVYSPYVISLYRKKKKDIYTLAHDKVKRVCVCVCVGYRSRWGCFLFLFFFLSVLAVRRVG